MSQDRLDSSIDIDRRSSIEIVRLIQEQDRLVADAVSAEAEKIAHAIDQIADRLSNNGRLFYAGAGTSGRIAMLDASEVPPTYGMDVIKVLMAGGQSAFFDAVEGAEDDEDAAIETINANVKSDDALVGIAASGTTPYTVAAVRRANMLGALTVGITSVPGSPLAREVDIAIAPQTGPEVIMGSTRMKSGTAQKLVLNTISTVAMIRLGRTYGGLMVGVVPTNEKLRERARRNVVLATGASEERVDQALDAAAGDARVALVSLLAGVDADAARSRLEASDGSVRKAAGS